MKPYRIIRINGVLYETMLKDVEEVFRGNRIVRILLDTGKMDLNDIWTMCGAGCFDTDEIVGLYAALGYDIDQMPDSLYENLIIEEVIPSKGLSNPMKLKVTNLLADYYGLALEALTTENDARKKKDKMSAVAMQAEADELMSTMRDEAAEYGIGPEDVHHKLVGKRMMAAIA